MSKICQRYAKDMLKIFQRYVKDMPKMRYIYVKDTPKICQRYTKDMPKICQNSNVPTEFIFLINFIRDTKINEGKRGASGE